MRVWERLLRFADRLIDDLLQCGLVIRDLDLLCEEFTGV